AKVILTRLPDHIMSKNRLIADLDHRPFKGATVALLPKR
ncbi:MAG: hypothetical protein ACI9TA_003491, partial [Reinekea sp.]